MNFDVIFSSLPFILGGLGVTLQFTVLSLLVGLPLGILLAFAKISPSKMLSAFAATYTSFFRGTPLLVQLGLCFFAIPQLTGIPLTPFQAGILTFSLNSAAYVSEVIRAGILSVSVGQREAATLLGLSKTTTFRKIVLPQAVRNTFPALVNEMVDLLKESSLVSTIGEADLLRRARIVASEKFLYFEPLLAAALGYYLVVLLMSYLSKKLEKKMTHA